MRGTLVIQQVKNLPAMHETQETWVQSLGQEDPLEEKMALQYSCLENPMDQGFSSWGHKESDMTEWLNTHPGPCERTTEMPLAQPGRPAHVLDKVDTYAKYWNILKD